LSPSQIKNIERLTISLADKIINDPIIALKKIAQRSSKDTYLGMTRKLFNLDKDINEEE
jgi:glutamyl-tRNA reductase